MTLVEKQRFGVSRGQRWLARLAFAATFAAVVVVLLAGALASITALVLGFAGWRLAARRRGGSWPAAVSCAGWRWWPWSPRRSW